jgi:uncharacterized protein YgbK (DUF1537 family)
LDKSEAIPMPTEARIPDFVPPSFADPYSGRIILLADDLTGACDAGAAFLRTGRTVRIWFGAGVEFSTPESVQAFNTNSRALSDRRAAQAVSPACTALGGDPNSLFFKKVDSAARGPLAAELLAAHRTLATRAVLFAPAFPAAGRTVRDGILEIEDAAGQHSQVRLERLFPLTVRAHSLVIPHLRSAGSHPHGRRNRLSSLFTLGAHSFILQGELAPGIPWGIVQGGMAEGCIVITKSGGFGSPTIFNEILAALRGPRMTRLRTHRHQHRRPRRRRR